MSIPTEPTIIGEIRLNARDVARVDLSSFNGRPVVSVREWYSKGEGDDLKPTPKGITLSVEHLPTLAPLLGAALSRARADGLLPQEGD